MRVSDWTQPLYWPVNADGQALPFKDGAFDAVVCQLGLQYFPEPAAGLMEFRRVVRPGGMVAVCVNSTSDRQPMWGNLADAVSPFIAQQQRDVLQMSWSLADPRRLQGLFSEAGFHAIRVEQIRREYTSMALKTIGGRSKREMGRSRRHTTHSARQTVARYAKRFVHGWPDTIWPTAS